MFALLCYQTYSNVICPTRQAISNLRCKCSLLRSFQLYSSSQITVEQPDVTDVITY